MTLALTLTQLLDAGEHHARHILLQMKETQLTPFYHLVSADRQQVVGCVFDGVAAKEAAAAAVTKMARKMNAHMAMFVSEAWMAVLSPQEYEQDDTPPSQRPNRVEVVILVATDGNTTLQRVLNIARNKRGRITGLHRRDAGDSGSGGGRMIDGIIVPTTVH